MYVFFPILIILALISTTANSQQYFSSSEGRTAILGTPGSSSWYIGNSLSLCTSPSFTPREEAECKLKSWKEQVSGVESQIEFFQKKLKEYKANVDKFTIYLKETK